MYLFSARALLFLPLPAFATACSQIGSQITSAIRLLTLPLSSIGGEENPCALTVLKRLRARAK